VRTEIIWKQEGGKLFDLYNRHLKILIKIFKARTNSPQKGRKTPASQAG
jgi:hypothetical protein